MLHAMQLRKPLILASASPRRRRILTDLGLSFEVRVPAVEELATPADPAGAARENARRKHTWCQSQAPDHLVVAADTVIDFDGRLIGKPRSRTEAESFLRAFSGRDHRVLTATALTGDQGNPDVHLTTSLVRFRELAEADVYAYLETVSALDKAGAYDIGENGEAIIAGYGGSWSNILGLPTEVLHPWLQRWQAQPADGIVPP